MEQFSITTEKGGLIVQQIPTLAIYTFVWMGQGLSVNYFNCAI